MQEYWRTESTTVMLSKLFNPFTHWPNPYIQPRIILQIYCANNIVISGVRYFLMLQQIYVVVK